MKTVADVLREAKELNKEEPWLFPASCLLRVCSDGKVFSAASDLLDASVSAIWDRAIALASGTETKSLDALIADLKAKGMWRLTLQENDDGWFALASNVYMETIGHAKSDTPEAAVRALEQKVRMG